MTANGPSRRLTRGLVRALTAALLVLGWANAQVTAQAPAQATTPRVAVPAPPATVGELGALVEQARARFVARDAAGVLAHVAEDYRSAGMTKPAVRDQLLALYSLYDAVRARVQVDQVQLVDGDAWIYTTGEVSGRLPIVGWVTVLSWQREPEVARRQGAAWRLIGFQD
jgi:hypothetical protein